MTLTHILVDYENTQPSADEVALVRGRDQRLWIFRGPGQRKYDALFAEALLALGERAKVIACEKSGRNALDMHIALHIGRLLGAPGEDAAAGAPAFTVVSRDTDYEPVLQYVRKLGCEARRATSIGAAVGPDRAEKAAAVGTPSTRRAASAAKTRQPAAAKAAKKSPAAKAAKAPAKAAAKEPAKAPVKSAAKAPARGARSSPRTAPPAAPAKSEATLIEDLATKVRSQLELHPRNRPTRRDRLESWLASRLRGKLAGNADVAAVVAWLEARGLVAFTGNKVEYPQWT